MTGPASLTVHDLSLAQPASDAPVVLAVHGITANGRSWTAVAEAVGMRFGAGAVRFLAPDLRGRACSRDAEGPLGIGGHADDIVALAEACPQPPVLVGHSMGGFVAALASSRSPQAFRRTVLVDGGLALAPPPSADVDAALQAVIGPAMTRLSMRFEGLDAYLAFWADHPSVGPLLQGPAAPAVRAYLMDDLVPVRDGSPEWRSSCSIEAVRADGADLLTDHQILASVWTAADRGVPMSFLWAARGMLDEPQGLYDEERLAALDPPAALTLIGVPGVNHYSILFDPSGVDAVVDAVATRLSPPP